MNRVVRSVVKHKDTAPVVKKEKLISSGCTLLNLAASGKSTGAFQRGTCINIVGGSFAGKSVLAKTILAEMARDPEFTPYTLVEDNIEYSYELDKQMGSSYKKRVIAPQYAEDGRPLNSEVFEDMQDSLLALISKGAPFAYSVDSLDALSSSDEQAKAKKDYAARHKKKTEEGDESTKTGGTYGMERAKALTKILRLFFGKIYRTKSFGIIISQIRDNVEMFSFKKETRAGGRALKHYSHHEIWLTQTKPIKKGEYIIGTWVKAVFEKNRITGKRRTIEFAILIDYGIDDLRTSIKFLIDSGTWKKSGATISTGDFSKAMRESDLINYIEENDKEPELRKLVAATWHAIEDDLKPKRKPKYV